MEASESRATQEIPEPKAEILDSMESVVDGDLEEASVSSGKSRGIRKTKRHMSGGHLGPLEKDKLILGPHKNFDRKSRMGKGRGLPKKGGAGGKGTWGKPGCELQSVSVLGEKDPNYDPEECRDQIVVKSLSPPLNINEIHREVEDSVKEYFEHGDVVEVLTSLGELNYGDSIGELIYKVISVALDHHNSHRELASVLLADLNEENIVPAKAMEEGFDRVISEMSDLTLDTPDAPTVVGNFIARAVADDCLPPAFVEHHKGMLDGEQATAAMKRAEVLLKMKHGLVRLDNIWGMGGGQRPVKILSKKIELLLSEYLSSGDVAEATQCLVELEAPHFHHELVYATVKMTIEHWSETTPKQMCKFLKSLADAIIVTPVQIATGFKRVYDELADLVLDVPAAYSYMEELANICVQEGIISGHLLKQCPGKGRKRFISEGDGGRVKEFATFPIDS